VVSALEGGYNINGALVSAFARSVAAHVRALAEPHTQVGKEGEGGRKEGEEATCVCVCTGEKGGWGSLQGTIAACARTWVLPAAMSVVHVAASSAVSSSNIPSLV
jgi:hypothetical protein